MERSLFEVDKKSLASAKSADEFLQLLPRVHVSERDILQVAVIFTRASLDDVLIAFAKSTRSDIRLTSYNKSEVYPISYYDLSRTFGRKRRREVSGSFVTMKTSQPNVWLVTMVEPSPFWTDGLSRLLDLLYPSVIRPFYTQKEMSSFVLSVDERSSGDARVVRISGQERLKAKDSRRKYEVSLRWTDTDVRTAVREAIEEGLWFRNISLEILPTGEHDHFSPGSRATVSRNGYFSCTGSFGMFYETVVSPMINFAQSRLDFLSNRDRLGPDQTSRFLEAMKRFAHGTCSVLHGNPYVHVSVVDNRDFSAADVWVVNRNDILIVPQIKTSEAALERIVNHIFENFREGQLAEARETEV